MACSQLGIRELGVEIMPEAIATRDALGLDTLNISISDLPDDFCARAPIQIAGPPCQTFSMAGSGAGRLALEEVLRRVKAFGATREFTRGGSGDPRTWLVLEPLRLAVHGRPMFIVWEQVPPVLPVWEACADVLRTEGYSAWTGYLHAESFGVPQTRKRAFLIARRDGIEAAPPVPTHSRYHNRTPARLDDGVLPWVSMATALGWGTTGRPSPVPGALPLGLRELSEPSFGVTSKTSKWVYRNGNQANTAERSPDQPAPSVHFGARMNSVTWESEAASIRVSVQEAAVLQTFPADHPFQGAKGKQYLQIGNAVPPLLGRRVLETFL